MYNTCIHFFCENSNFLNTDQLNTPCNFTYILENLDKFGYFKIMYANWKTCILIQTTCNFNNNLD